MVQVSPNEVMKSGQGHHHMQNARPFSRIFTADVTINNSVTSGTTAKGVPFKKTAAATITKADGSTVTRTVMAFGDQLAEVGSRLRKGRTVSLAIQHDGGSVKVIGLPREKAQG